MDEVVRPWMAPGLSLAISLAAVTIAYRAGLAVARRVLRSQPLPRLFLDFAAKPAYAVITMIAVQMVLQSAPDAVPYVAGARHGAGLLLIAAFTWLAVRMCSAIAAAVALRHPLTMADNLGARRIQTQTRVLTRSLASAAVLVGISFALLTFPGVRNIGAGLLASAGVIGLVAGIAAKPIFGNLLAGLQIALSQPIRLDDVVIIEGEYGRIEEIGRTYVVVAVWDQRRLIVPLQHFIEKPFQNWTLTNSDLLGTVHLWVDYGMPLEPLRAELRRLCEAAPQWDGRVCLLQVTEASERAMQLRALVSSADSGRAWDLRCLVREGLIEFVRREYPACLPRLRAELADGPGRGGAPAAEENDATSPPGSTMRNAPSRS
jgi:small-conductance mechanosensitive channel